MIHRSLNKNWQSDCVGCKWAYLFPFSWKSTFTHFFSFSERKGSTLSVSSSPLFLFVPALASLCVWVLLQGWEVMQQWMGWWEDMAFLLEDLCMLKNWKMQNLSRCYSSAGTHWQFFLPSSGINSSRMKNFSSCLDGSVLFHLNEYKY